ncbi:uncharacterized protein F4822DRAFT_65147 [Hypoxylon trugodes]|uniref:uncharacterized protein n=1 Tax=Hypoxylon trugodes TaxID=326681 RepID=UPI00219FC158|nr:uncharacterized protein F4822DRAFT_65147 [Hypoxylon trugodes]KAI1384269.1 hypothetical protein F4822DRAFT_65147 [Hypoxylon trugodes]
MLRLFRPRPIPNTLSLVTRFQGSRRPSSQLIHVQRVKFQRRWFKPRNVVIAGCVYYFCYQVYKYSIIDTLDAWAGEQEKRLTEKERKEMDEDLMEPIFIPIPFTTKLVPSDPYKGTDPEWQTFIKVNKDPELLRSIQRGLAELVRKTAASNSVLVSGCGKDMTLGRYWLDIQYPHRPPPHYVRKGIEIDDHRISIVEEHIEGAVASVIERALWPSTLTLSLWSFSAALVKQNLSNFVKLFGYGSNPTPDPTIQKTMEKFQERIRKQEAESDPKTRDSLSSAKTQATDSSTNSTSPVDTGSAKSSPAPGSTASPSSSMSPIPVVPGAESTKPKSVNNIYGIEYAREHTSGPRQAFEQTFSQTWRPIRHLPPRGVIIVSGLVEVTSPRAIATIDVHAFWDPKTKNFDMRTAVFRLRQLRRRTQTPAR